METPCLGVRRTAPLRAPVAGISPKTGRHGHTARAVSVGKTACQRGCTPDVAAIESHGHVRELELQALKGDGAFKAVAGGNGRGNDLATFIVKSDNFKALLSGNGKSCSIQLPEGMLAAQKAAIVSQGQDLSPAMRIPGIVNNPLRAQRVRDLLPVGTTGNNLVGFTRENVFTNNAGPQYSPPNTEIVTKPDRASPSRWRKPPGAASG